MTDVLIASYVALWILVVALTVSVLAVYYHFGRLYISSREGRYNEGPDLGATVESSELLTLRGELRPVPSERTSSLLIFTSTSCLLCDRLRRPLSQFAEAHSEVDVVVVCAGKEAEVGKWARELSEKIDVIADGGGRVASQYGVSITPFCVGVDRSVVRTKGIVNGTAGLDVAAEHLLSEPLPAYGQGRP